MYLSHFNLKFIPFSLTPDMDFNVELVKQKEALEVLLTGLRQGEGFMKITGEVGTGKTYLCRKLVKLVADDYETVLILDPNLNRIGLLKEIAESLLIPFDGLTEGRDLLKQIQNKILSIYRKNKKVLIIVDEAQYMPSATLEALRLLTNFEMGRKKMMQVILFGQSELDERLKLMQLRPLRQRIVFSYELKPMLPNEVRDYLQQRLRVAGGRMMFGGKTLPALYRFSGGIPRMVNILAHKALLSAYGRGKYEVNKIDIHAAAKDTQIIASSKMGMYARPVFAMMMSGALFIVTFCVVQFLRAIL